MGVCNHEKHMTCTTRSNCCHAAACSSARDGYIFDTAISLAVSFYALGILRLLGLIE